MLCLSCGADVEEFARTYPESGDGYCVACNPTDEEWAREMAECRRAAALAKAADTAAKS